MQTYQVIITRDTTESTVIQVTAESPEAAEAEALAASYNGRYTWEQDDTPNASGEHYVTGVEAEAE
jgi:hypothetical protein